MSPRRVSAPGADTGAAATAADALPPIVAAVDLGSNSFHMVVARTTGGELSVVDRLREMVQLEASLDDAGCIAGEGRRAALEALGRFGERLRHMPPGSVRAVGTNTLRRARNSRRFIAEAEAALGHPIETVAGIEEARLVYLGVAHTTPGVERRLVVDIGGGSTEFIIGERFEPIHMESLYVGCVNTSLRFFEDGVVDAGRLARAELVASQELEAMATTWRRRGWERAVGASGTIRAIRNVARGAGWCDDLLTRDALAAVREAIVAAGHTKHLRFPGLSADRRRVFPGGFAVLSAVFGALGIEAMQPADGSLREGLLYDLVGRIREEDVRARSVQALADRCHVDWDQARRVERTALELLDDVAEDWKLVGREPRALLAWGARLHEIGLDIAHNHYHRHGEYIVTMADLAGFSMQEQAIVGILVRAHRRKLSAVRFRDLPRQWSRSALRLAVLLRLAVVLHRSRSPEDPPRLRLSARKKALQLDLPEGVLDRSPLLRADLEQEAAYLRAAGLKLSY